MKTKIMLLSLMLVLAMIPIVSADQPGYDIPFYTYKGSATKSTVCNVAAVTCPSTVVIGLKYPTAGLVLSVPCGVASFGCGLVGLAESAMPCSDPILDFWDIDWDYISMVTPAPMWIVVPHCESTGGVFSYPGDTNGDYRISDHELLNYIDAWSRGEVSDQNLLTCIDIWSAQ